MEIGSLRLHAFAIDSDGALMASEVSKMGVFNENTNKLVLASHITQTGEVVINKDGENLVVAGNIESTSGSTGKAFATALSGLTGDEYLTCTDTSGLVVGAELKDGVTSLGVIIALTSTRVYLSQALLADVSAITTAKQYYSIIVTNPADNTLWLIADENKISPLDAVTVSDGIFMGEFTGVSVETNATPIDYKGLGKYAKEQSYSEITCNITINELASNKELLAYINGYNTTDDDGDSSVSIIDNPFAQTKPKDVKLIGIRQMTDDVSKDEIHVWHRVKGSSFTLANSKGDFSTESKVLMGMERNKGNSDVYSIFIG